MKRDEAFSLLQAHKTELKRMGVDHLYLFGSMARDDARPDSNIDLFFDHERGKLGLYELIDVQEYTTGILGRKADIMTRNSIHPDLKQRIEKSAVLVF